MDCDGEWWICGFSMGPAFFGTDSVATVNTSLVTGNIQDFDFVRPWSGVPQPVSPQWAWGLDTSNVAPIIGTHGVAYAWEIWRGAPAGSIVDRGNAVASITLGDIRPMAGRIGPLLSGPDAVHLGLLAVLRDGPYIYIYSIAGQSNLIIGRVEADDSVFDAARYTFLSSNSTSTSPIWINTKGIPSKNNLTGLGATTANPSGQFGCAVYGSVYFNTYVQKYIILCKIFENFVNMYISNTPWGPWSAEYGLMDGGRPGVDAMVKGSYRSMVHEMYGNGDETYFSTGPNGVFNLFKLSGD